MKITKSKLLLLLLLALATLVGVQKNISAKNDKPQPPVAKQDDQKVEKQTEPAPEKKQELPKAENKSDDKADKVTDQATEDDDLEILSEKAEFYEKCNHIFSTYVDKDGNVDYPKLRRKRSVLAEAVRSIQKISPLQYMAWNDTEKKAFWINAHNIFTLKLIIDNYPIEPVWYMINFPKNCIKHINGGRGRGNIYFYVIDREQHTIREMEYDMLLRSFDDLRVIFALSYASRSSAFLRNEVYLPEKLDEQLDDQVRRFLASERGMLIEKGGKNVALSGIFTWYREFFVKSEYANIKKFRQHPEHTRAYLNFIVKYAPEEDASFLNSSEFTAKKTLPYNWELNEKQRK